MFDIKSGIRNFINRTFKDEVIDVNPPQEYYCTYRDVGIRLESYIVTVTYKYAGKKKLFFDIDNDHFQLVSPKRALERAERFYMRTLQQLESCNSQTR